MNTTPPAPGKPAGQPPGKPREALLRYFEDWPAGTRVAPLKPTEWSAERDREDDREEDDDDDDDDEDDDDQDEGSAPPRPAHRPRSEKPVPRPAGIDKPRRVVERAQVVSDNETVFVATSKDGVSPVPLMVEHHYMHATQWARDPRSKEPGWVVRPVTYRKVIVFRLLV